MNMTAADWMANWGLVKWKETVVVIGIDRS
jgi:hypothetical protein